MESEYRQRREQVMAKISGGTAIFRSAPTAVMHNDVEYVYRQDSDFYYLTGFNEPEAVAVLAPHHGEHRFILFVQPKDREKEVWSGYRCGVEGAKEIYGADIAYPITELDDKLPQYLQKAERIYYHLGRDSHFNDRMIRHYQNLLATRPRRGTGPIAIEDTGPIIHGLRLHKSNFEVDLMRQAADIAVLAHNHAMSIARPGSYEYEIQAEIEHIFRLQGGMGPAYPSIVAAGKNACVLHYIENNYQMQEQELLLIDAGCAYKYYNSDITRTFPINGKFTPEQKALYEIVLEAQKQAIQEVKPGNGFDAPHKKAVQIITEGLIEVGLLKGEVNQLIQEGKYKQFYMHRTSHWLGLDVHDVGVYQHGEVPQVLQPGQVLTIEPGLYVVPHT
ncbi:aminopeptidase P N-terminal domain-containing protein, partial [Cylindrospermopsis raciborskii CS-506_A]